MGGDTATINIYDDTPETAPRIKIVRPKKPKSATDKIRVTRAYRQARADFRKQAAAYHNSDGSKGEPCWICRKPIDYSLKHGHPFAWTLDHFIPVRDAPGLIWCVQNWRSAHSRCNDQRGAGESPLGMGIPSESW
jgi:5-methylcytosine-specific restriction endonuclease McrA